MVSPATIKLIFSALLIALLCGTSYFLYKQIQTNGILEEQLTQKDTRIKSANDIIHKQAEDATKTANIATKLQETKNTLSRLQNKAAHNVENSIPKDSTGDCFRAATPPNVVNSTNSAINCLWDASNTTANPGC